LLKSNYPPAQDAGDVKNSLRLKSAMLES